MSVKLLLLILVSTFLSATGAAQDNYRPKQKDLSWGAKAHGLRMVAWTNPTINTVFAVVRNFSARKISYCDSEYGNAASVHARKNAASKWQELKFKTPPGERTMLPICVNRALSPKQEMPLFTFYGAVRQGKNYSFSLDLREYDFPADWSGTVEVRIVHFVQIVRNRPCNFDKGECGNDKVESQPIKIKLPFSKATARK